MTDHSHLPESYLADSGERVTDPAYRLTAPHFFDDTYWTEDDVIVTNLEPTPFMEPLNQAAGERLEMWMQSLPAGGQDLSLSDLTEAAMMLRPREGEPELSTEAFQAAVLKLASELKTKRRGGEPVVPHTQNVRGAAQKAAPPLGNARFANAEHAQIQRRVQYQQELPASRVKKAVPHAGNIPTSVKEGA